jgi:hypothetical protein
VGEPFVLQLSATNGPEAVCADSAELPPGLAVDCATGLIAGTPTAAGEYPVTVTAVNDGGAAAKEVLFRIVDDPHRGFFSGSFNTGGSAFSLVARPGRDLFLCHVPEAGLFAGRDDVRVAPDGTFEIPLGAAGAGPAAAGGASAPPVLRGRISGDAVTGEIAGAAILLAGTRAAGPERGAAYRMAMEGEVDGSAFVVADPAGWVAVYVQTSAWADFGACAAAGLSEWTIATAGGRSVRIEAAQEAVRASIVDAGGTEHKASGLAVGVAPERYVVNLSGRAWVDTEANPAITGFVITGTEPVRVLVRAAGPALAAFGVPGVLADPKLAVLNEAREKIAENLDWEPSCGAVAARVGAFDFAGGSRDAALVITLAPGLYHALATPQGGGAEAGVCLVEVYDAGEAEAGPRAARLVNVSDRSWVAPGERALIGGFVVTGNFPKRVVVRGIGPALAGHGVARFLADPALALYRRRDGREECIAQNDDWADAGFERKKEAFARVGAFPLPDASKDSAIVVVLEPGVYTAVLHGNEGGAGNALLEVYEADVE